MDSCGYHKPYSAFIVITQLRQLVPAVSRLPKLKHAASVQGEDNTTMLM